jgi:HlyD family secretion protein
MKINRRLVVGIGAAIAAALSRGWAFAPRPIAVELATTTKGRFESSIDEDARTRLSERYVVSAPLAGRLARITLREGDPVEAGMVVATLAPALPPLHDERTARELAARVDAAQALLERAVTRVERAQIAVQQAAIELRRSEELAQQGFVSAARIESERLAAQAARKELESAVHEQQVAGHELEQARAARGAARQPATAVTFEVRAPVSGRVLRVPQTSESTVALGTPLLEIGDTTRLEVVAELLTTDALQATPGTRVVIERWGGPQPLEGRVRRVEPAAFTKISALGVEEQRVNVLIDLLSPPQQWSALGDGYRVGVRIVTITVDDALRVPVSAVFPLPAADDGQVTGVYTVKEGRARLVPVQVGGRNGVHAWVRAGLDVGTPVIVYPPPAVKDGVRVVERRV